MKQFRYFFLYIIVIFCFSSFRNPGIIEQTPKSILVIRVEYHSFGMSGLGGFLKIRNIDTNEVFVSKKRIGFYPFVVISDIPDGNYVVEELQIMAGSNKLIIRDELCFNTIHINGAKIYYLGRYLAEKIPPLLKLNFLITMDEKDDESKIYKQVRRESDAWLKYQIGWDHQLFKKDSTQIEILTYGRDDGKKPIKN
jgi:hypothetical protein